uniref:Uncharacterized protein n=1 Tax=uncultured prokaryote TaxID=198431 RepID=A0A0H5Q5N2_9ZZZZ|nr:hypothetical protein [uncultured prokaryote]
MTYRPHILLQFGGVLGANEQWSCNLRAMIGSYAAAEPAPGNAIEGLWNSFLDSNIEDMYQDVFTWFTDSDARISNVARLDFLKANIINAQGRYMSQENTREWRPPTGPVGTVGPGPYQDTLVVSLLTDANRGRAHRGRIYPPTGQFVVAPSGKITTELRDGVANAAQELLDNLNNQTGIDVNNFRVVVASDLGNPGPIRDVTQIAVGNVVDTQRRRRKSLVEDYVNRPITIQVEP